MSNTQFSELDIDRFFNVAHRLVLEAGNTILIAISREKNVGIKSVATDLVTETDKAVETMLVDGIRKSYPNHKFIGEETVSANSGKIEEFTDDPTWIIDPIDGTMNFVHSHPMVSISVALAINKKIVIGIVYAPVINSMYTAIKGQGAKLNGLPIKVSDCTDIKEAMLLMEVHSRDSEDSMAVQRENFPKVLPAFHAFRTIGSAAIDLALIASGSSDVFFHFGGLHCWDVAAGALLVTEAGGCVMDSRDGSEFNYMDRYMLAAANRHIADQVVALGLSHVQREKDFPEHCPL